MNFLKVLAQKYEETLFFVDQNRRCKKGQNSGYVVAVLLQWRRLTFAAVILIGKC